MKTAFRIALLVLIIGGVWILMLYNEAREYRNRVNKIAYVVIEKSEWIEGLVSIDITICDSVTHFNIESLNDTIGENIAISDKIRPCDVHFTYNFNSGDQKVLKTENFNCHGCSGSNNYFLYNDSVKYEYNN